MISGLLNLILLIRMYLKGYKGQFSISQSIFVSQICLALTIRFVICVEKLMGLIFGFSGENPGEFKYNPGVLITNLEATL